MPTPKAVLKDIRKKVLASLRHSRLPAHHRAIKNAAPPEHRSIDMPEANAFKVYTTILRELRALNVIIRDQVMEAISEELYGTKPMAEDTEVIPSITMLPPRSPGSDELLSVEDAAKLAGVSKPALYTAIRRGVVLKDESSGSIMVPKWSAQAYRANARPRRKSKSKK